MTFEERLKMLPGFGFVAEELDPVRPPRAINAGGNGQPPFVVTMEGIPIGVMHRLAARMLVAGTESHRLLVAVLDSLEAVARAEGDDAVAAALKELMAATPVLAAHIEKTMREVQPRVPSKEDTH